MKTSFGSIFVYLTTILIVFLNFDYSNQMPIQEKGLLEKRQLYKPSIDGYFTEPETEPVGTMLWKIFRKFSLFGMLVDTFVSAIKKQNIENIENMKTF